MPSPRSTLFPYPPLFRSPGAFALVTIGPSTMMCLGMSRLACRDARAAAAPATIRSEERVSRDAEPEIYPLPLPSPLPLPRRVRSRDDRAVDDDVLGDVEAGLPRRSRSRRAGDDQIGRAGQQGCRARDLPSSPTLPSSAPPARSLS